MYAKKDSFGVAKIVSKTKYMMIVVYLNNDLPCFFERFLKFWNFEKVPYFWNKIEIILRNYLFFMVGNLNYLNSNGYEME